MRVRKVRQAEQSHMDSPPDTSLTLQKRERSTQKSLSREGREGAIAAACAEPRGCTRDARPCHLCRRWSCATSVRPATKFSSLHGYGIGYILSCRARTTWRPSPLSMLSSNWPRRMRQKPANQAAAACCNGPISVSRVKPGSASPVSLVIASGACLIGATRFRCR